MEIKELVAVVRADIASFVTNMKTVGKVTQDFQTSWGNASTAVLGSFNRMATGALTFFGSIAAYTAKVGVEFRAMTENAEVMLTTLTGSAEKAKNTLAQLLKFSKETPFEFAGVQAASIQLLNAKVKAEELIPVLRKVGDAVASVGGGDEALRGVAMALSQMMTAGRVNAQDMMQLTNRGIAGWDMLAKRLGKSVAEVREMSERGALDGRESAMLIIDEMGKRGAGAAAAMSLRFTGLWSSLKDDFKQFCDKVWEPLYTSMVSIMGRISKGFNSGGMEPILNRLRTAIQQVTNTIMQLIATHGEQAINNLVSAFVWLAQATSRTVVSLREMMPTLILTGQRIWDFLAPLLAFLQRNPELIAAFLALKVTGVLGLNTAFLALIQALMATLGLLGKLPALLASLGPMMATLFATPAAMAFVTALAAVAAGYALYKKQCDEAAAAKRAFDDAHTEKEKDLTEGFLKGRSAEDLHKMDATAAEARQKEKAARDSGNNREADNQKFIAEQAEKKRNQTLEEMRATRAEMEKQENDLRKSSRDKFAAGDNEGGSTDLNKAHEMQRKNAPAIRQIEAERKKYIDKVEQDRMARQAEEAAQADAPKGPSKAERDLEKKVRDLENKGEQKRAALPGLDKMRDLLLAEGMTPEMAGRVAGAQNGADAGDAKKFKEDYAKINPKDKDAVDELTQAFLERLKAKLDAASTKKEVETGTAKTENHLKDMNLYQGQMERFTKDLKDLNKAFTEGRITEQEYKLGLDDIAQAARDAARENKQKWKDEETAGKVARDSLDKLRDKARRDTGYVKKTPPAPKPLKKGEKPKKKKLNKNGTVTGVKPPVVTAFEAYMNGLEGKFDELRTKLSQGSITLEQYKEAVADIEEQTERATQAERERKLINGDFAGAGMNFQQSLQTKMAAIRENQWNQYVDSFANRLMGVGDAMNGFQNNLMGLGTNIQFVGNQFQQVGNQFSVGGGGFDPAVAAQQMHNLFNSASGQADLIRNNISMLQQNLSMFQGNFQKQQEIQMQIDELQGQLNGLLAPRQQILTPTDPSFMRDPGMQSGGNRSVSVNLPNINRMTQADARLIADTVRDELNRRGSNSTR